MPELIVVSCAGCKILGYTLHPQACLADLEDRVTLALGTTSYHLVSSEGLRLGRNLTAEEANLTDGAVVTAVICAETRIFASRCAQAFAAVTNGSVITWGNYA